MNAPHMQLSASDLTRLEGHIRDILDTHGVDAQCTCGEETCTPEAVCDCGVTVDDDDTGSHRAHTYSVSVDIAEHLIATYGPEAFTSRYIAVEVSE